MKITFPILSHVEGDLFVKHTYGNVRKLVKAILKLSELPYDSVAYQRHLNKLWTSVDALDRSFKAQKRRWVGRHLPDASSPIFEAASYQRELSEHAEEITMLRVMLRGIDTASCSPLECAQVSLLRYAIQDDGFYMPEAKATIDRLLKECTDGASYA